ncbi:trans-sialidase [Trypanosoma rangeli]|uniref:Trans-sialidase n=1 Tax=Trypanosoma rangeli TaxID=5698 RepID=A0A3R7N0Z6_TRYRA|nr:trans-sialidase [Trypanosoma rangeli]RNE98213.1 trans-sialidase [Trypanosoma rangeli]|eukprot:RNE98213.1 trans-sialidase [Trypanosoma rangeli]
MQLLKGSDAAEKATEVMQLTTIVRGKDVYMLLGNYSRTTSKAEVPGKDGWKLFLVKGIVTGENDEKKIQWGEIHAVKPESGVHGSLTHLSGGGGSGVVLQDGTLVFPMQATDTKNGKGVFLAMRFIKPKKKWELSSGVTDGKGCRDPSIAEWGENQVVAMAPCEQGSYDVYKSPGDGKSWLGAEPISRV